MGLDPISWAIIGASVVGTGVKAYGEYEAGKSQQSLSNYNASVTETTADYNASQTLAVAERNAQLITGTADVNAGVTAGNARSVVADSLAAAQGMRYNNRQALGANRARTAAGGVVVGTGSPLAVEVAQAGLLELRALETERQGRVRADQMLNQSAVDTWQAREQAKAEKWQAEGSANMTRWAGRQQGTLDRMSGASAARAGKLGAAATILQGAGNAYGTYKGLS